MTWEVLTACGWPTVGHRPTGDHLTPPKVMLVQEQSGVDGTFLLASLLTNHLKGKDWNRVLLFATHHSAAHYTAACQKLTFNTAAAIQSGRLHIVDVLAELYNHGDDMSGPDPLEVINGRLQKAPASCQLVLVDDLSFLAAMIPSGGENAVINFVENLLAVAYPTQADHIVLKVSASECYERICAYLIDMVETIVTLEPLPSGNFREVDGRLTVHRKPHRYGLREHHKTLLYKVGDRQIRAYHSGEVGIKNL